MRTKCVHIFVRDTRSQRNTRIKSFRFRSDCVRASRFSPEQYLCVMYSDYPLLNGPYTDEMRKEKQRTPECMNIDMECARSDHKFAFRSHGRMPETFRLSMRYFCLNRKNSYHFDTQNIFA